MNVGAVGGGMATAQAMAETQIALQKKTQDMAKSEMSAVLQMVAPPPSHLGRNVDVSA